MNPGKHGAFLLLILITIFCGAALPVAELRAAATEQLKSAPIDLITAQELKMKVDNSAPVTIIDVRATNMYLESDSKIKGAIHIKLRRLKWRLGFPPLKNVPMDREMVTYCACPNDESSIRAAQVLLDAGFKRVRVLKGGWQAWVNVKGK